MVNRNSAPEELACIDKVSELDQMRIFLQTESFLAVCISLVHELDKP